MNFKTIFRKKKAVSAVIGAVLLIGLAITAVGILYATLDLRFDSSVRSAGAIIAEDSDNDGLIDRMTVSLVNKGLTDANIQSVSVIQDGNTFMWYTFDESVDVSEVTEIDIYAVGTLQQVEPAKTFYIEINFQDDVYISSGYTTIVGDIPDEIIGTIGNEDPFVGYCYLISRTVDDDQYAKKYFPTDVGCSPSLWFLLGAFEDDNKKPNFDNDYISLCGYGDEAEFQPYLLDEREFSQGNIGSQSNYIATPYNDTGDHPGLVAFDKYGNWDKNDDLNWGKYGIAYMWSYIYIPGTEAVICDVGVNGASEYQLWLNGEQLVSGNKHNRWYTAEGITLEAGVNLVMMKISAKTDAHFAGQVLFFDSEQLPNLYSIWPTLGDL